MSDDELFENWWRVHSPPGTFDGAQCKVAFVAGLITQRVQSAQQSRALDAATAAAQQEEIQNNLRNCKCVVVETPRQ